jgi:nitrogen fixation NifU-like protein
MDFYQENILDHGQHPRHWGLLDPHDLHASDENPLCGDQLELTLRLDENDIVTGVGWAGQGCLISQATASMLGDELLGKSLDEIKKIDKEDILDMLGIPLSASRVKCALLSLKVAKTAAYNLEHWSGDDE